MKKTLLILFCWVSFLNADINFISANTGNDSNGGTGWGDAWLTIGNLVANAANGDTNYVVGLFQETYAPAHTDMFFLDSTRAADGWDEFQPDTVWSATFDGDTNARFMDISTGDHRLKFVGISFLEGTADAVLLRNSADDAWFQQCKFTGLGVFLSSIDTATFISCLFLSPTATATGILEQSPVAEMLTLHNNTFYGNWTTAVWGAVVMDSADVRNNIMQNISTTDFDVTIRIDAVSEAPALFMQGRWDFNIYESAENNGDVWRFSAFFGLIATWRDSVDNYAGTGAEGNSLNADPSLQNVTTTAYILDTSNAFEAGTDLGFGTDIGYYQVVPAAAGGTPATKKAVRPRWWN